MSALLPRWTNIVARGTLLAVVAIAGGVPLVLMWWVRSSFATGEGMRVAQPIPFDHRIHAHSLRIDCRYCHATVERAANAGMPPTVACVGCHNAVLLDSRPLAPVRVSLASNQPLRWQRVNALPDFVFFNHSIHIAKGVGCETCHGRVDEMGQVTQATPLSMGWCLSCHRDPAPNLRPRAEVTTMGFASAHRDGQPDTLGKRLMREYGVQPRTNCSTCHR